MSCSKWVERIAMMLEGSLGEAELKELKDHLAGCARCRTELLLQKRIDAALRVEMRSALPADFTQRVAARAAEISRKERRARPWVVLVPPLAAAASVAALFALGLDVARDNPSAFETLAAGFMKPMVWISQAIISLVGSAGSLAGREAPSVARLSTPEASFVLSTLIAILPAAWSIRRIFVFMRR